MKTCKCGREMYYTSKMCRTCYEKEYKCQDCLEPLRSRHSIRCYDCYLKQCRKICDSCKRTIDDKKRLSWIVCNSCYKKEYRKNNSDKYEIEKENAKQKRRKISGIDKDSPPLRSPNGSGYVNRAGYRVISKLDHPNAYGKGGSRGRIFEHTFIMSEYLGRPLNKNERVHHKNGIRNDNRIENLELWHVGQPSGQRIEDKIDWAKKFLEEYGYTISGK